MKAYGELLVGFLGLVILVGCGDDETTSASTVGTSTSSSTSSSSVGVGGGTAVGGGTSAGGSITSVGGSGGSVGCSTPADCDDGVTCTDDVCLPDGTCTSTANDSNCDNNAFCDGTETCDPTLDCQAGTAPVLDDGVMCTVDSCDEVNDEIVHVPSNTLCDDGMFCNGPELCDPTLDCQAGAPPIVDDGVMCTDDSCDEANNAIVNVVNNATCDDGMFCNGAEICDATLDCQAGVPTVIDDGVMCTDDSCDEANDIVVNTINNANCNDALFCNGIETCSATMDCQAGAPPVINDGVPCTDDSCDETNDVIVNAVNNANCDDSLFCNGSEVCDAQLNCQAGTSPVIDDGVGCTNDSCDEVNDVVVNVPNDSLCPDADSCSTGSCDAVLDCTQVVTCGDVCASPYLVGALPYSNSANTTGAANDYGYSTGQCPGETTWGNGAPDHAYLFTPDATDSYDINLTGVNFDSNLYVVNDCADIANTCLGANESVGSNITELLQLDLTGGADYFALVDGFSNTNALNDGAYTLDISATGDTCGNAIPISAAPFSATGTTSGNGQDYGFSANACPGETSSWGNGARDEVYAFTPTVTRSYTIDLTGAGFDSLLYIVTDCTDIDNTCIAADEEICSNCTESITTTLTAGTTYYIIVDGWSNTTLGGGDFTLAVN